ncbi:MAG: ATP-binding cassette domain-containing protein [Spirochaetes bacterium]|nr:ATP-binding cassette domain-containing protein [Spirochaetota bacterium]
MNTGNEYIRFDNVSKVFSLAGRKKEVVRAVDGIDLSVKKGEFVSIVGASGSGKTTILKLISGILSPSEGTVSVKGEAVQNLRRDTGNVFQKATLLPWRTVLKNVLLPLEVVRGEITDDDRRRAFELLETMGMKGTECMYPSELSGGMQQRVAIARALIFDPEILLLDEPFGALDSITRERLNRLLLSLWRRTKKTIVFVTHSISEAVLLSTRIVVLSGTPGRVKDIVELDPERKEKKGDIFSSEYISKTVVGVRKRIRDVWSEEIAPTRRFGEERKKRASFFKRLVRHYEYLLIPAGLALFVLLWGAVAGISGLPPYILPLPKAVLVRFAAAVSEGLLIPNLLVTAFESITGFVTGASCAFLIGYVLAKRRTAERLFSPYIVAMQAIPIVALAPLLVIWFGFGVRTKILIAALTVFFPVLVNSIVGIRYADREIMELLRSLDAGPFKTFFKFELPSALPVIFGGLKVSITFSVIGAVVGEFLGSSEGLGALVNMARASFDTPLVFVSIITLGALGIFFYLTMSLFEYVLLGRHRRHDE